MLILLLGIIGSAALLAATSREVGVCDSRRPIHALLGLTGMSLGLCSAAVLADGFASSITLDNSIHAAEESVAEADETESTVVSEPTASTTASDKPEPETPNVETDATIVENPEPEPVEASEPDNTTEDESLAEPIEIETPVTARSIHRIDHRGSMMCPCWKANPFVCNLLGTMFFRVRMYAYAQG